MNSHALLTRRLSLGAVALALVGGMAYVLLRTGPLAPIKVTVVQPTEGTLNPAIFGIGTVEARRSWMVGPTVAGRVLSVKVDVGDVVKAGQLLAEMDPVDLNQRLAALDASLARAGSTQAAAQALVLDASARRKLAAINTQRNQDLARQNFISSGALDAKLQEQASADAAALAAQANLAGAGQDAARLRAERAALAQQRDNVRLFAPADAVVTTRDAEAGSTVVAGQPVLRLMDPASLWVKLRVDQGRSAGLANGVKASIVLRSRPQTALPGQVARIELLADSVTEERIAQVAFDVPPTGLSVGEMAEVTLQLPATAPALLLPNAAIGHQKGQSGVWRIKDGKPEFAAVQFGVQSLDGQVQVLKGLDQSDQVVVYSQKALSNDARIAVVDALVKPGAPQ
ncbi:MAG: efflux RND transporter periplasmic adaptor subunit [Gammaproteobacteria bacterium]|uniref:efflux RND transporter periplasmic adaptor subunit n=1 Tax=Rhodoferax sp. TaxID=50421 RepID=UPI00183A801A|nr:efflux RND transporter periplasmic adaptor subunit [Rhodoferax sp.]MBU3900617.1 efflux RND transporter periplasmic adaptor subunit [Gammaproteobacteria bacterium]MBA3059088.1 efflux RND transporter periplasmic adaptor subunit [Rhodoferax sp.]MBU3996720.1 efflux RND transporter periplasmic adaptor subunit [Gammaproteobacteria bacterium]MBU4081007.1 efflux RND transporter periplasmic adaptor subunit [Gammaproteobacteria bacterium]MBU4113181.1 efflux RND transporter periplasmic adaptor subunit